MRVEALQQRGREVSAVDERKEISAARPSENGRNLDDCKRGS